ncbi:MAG: hypothetical protein K9L17_08370 [Clostridiales bacterium]|nr:hypothetical protein [Clostridiales bacterium]MCF8022690.1 hypothetical protein [Clostridiales bacterium]
MEVKAIKPEKIIAWLNSAADKLLSYIQGISDPLAVIAVCAAGFIILIGIIFTVLGITRKLLSLGVYILLGTAIMYLFTNQPENIFGVVKGFIESLVGKAFIIPLLR